MICIIELDNVYVYARLKRCVFSAMLTEPG